MSKSVIPFYTPEESLRLINCKWKLTGQNFPVWKMHLDNILRAQGKLYVLEKPVSRPESNSPGRDFTQYFKYLEDESDVMSILIFSTSPEFTGDLRVKSCYQVVKDIEDQLGLYKHTGKLLIMQEIFSLKLKSGQSVKDHLIEMRRLFKCLSRLGYKMTQEELVYLMWFSLTKEIQDTASAYMKEPKKDVDKVHEDILASLEPVPEPADFMDTDIIDELGDLSCLECGNEDICEHLMNIDQIEIGLPDAPGIFMIDCLITSYESWVIDTGSGNHICNHLQGFTRRKTLRKDRSNLRVGEGTPLIAEAVGSYSLSLPSGLVLELDNCYYIPNMIKNVLSFDLLVDQEFYYKYDYKMFSVFKDNIFYFKATPVNGLYTVNLQDNSSEIYHISKRSKDIEDQTYLWHCRLGHINKKRVELLLKGGFLGTFNYKPFDNCESCLSGKMTKQPFNKENERATDLLEIIHTDVCGPFSHIARGGYRYFITFTDDFSRYGYVYLMRHKSESFERFKEFQNEVQNQLDRKIKFLRSDRGGEYLSDEFDNHLMECGIVSQLTPPYTPQMNGVSERRNRTLLDMVRTMMCHSTLPMSFWGHALETAAHILNRAPTKSVENSPYELWKGKKPNMSFLRIWGCEVYVKRPTSEKLKPKSDKCFFVGYPRTTVGYYFYNPEENKVFVARNGKFLEEKFLSSGNTRKDVDLQNVEPQSEPIEEVQTQDLRRSSRVRQEPDRYLGFLVSQDSGDLNEPTSYGEAVSGNESEQWQEAMKAEMQSMYDNQVWELTDLPQHCRAVGRKWVFKKKTDMDGNVHTFKARLVAKGFTQTHGIDYDETFSPVAMLKSIRILMAISAYFNYEIWQMDVKTAFLNGKLTEDVYMEQPEGFEDPKNPNKVCKLLKSIYGLKQASRSWNLHFDERIKEFGFAKSEFEPCVYTKFSGSIVTFLVLYMKDLGEAAYILGIKIYRNRSKRLIGLSQSTYIDKLLKRFRMDESKKGFIPMQHGIVLSKTQCPVSSQDQNRMESVPYASAIGSIMYAMLCTRPDVAYSVSVTSRYQQNLGEPHWVAVKNILKYLRRTKDMFLVFGGSEDEISVTGYSDASFQTDRDDFRSQSGYVFTLNGGAISWKSSKQDTIADSTTEAEYIAASDAAKEAVWLRNFLSDLRVVASVSRPIDIFCDNSGAVAQAKEPREHHKSRHVLRKYHLIREIIGRGDVRICKIPTKDNVADPLTKPLARVKHEAHANSIGMQYLDASSPEGGLAANLVKVSVAVYPLLAFRCYSRLEPAIPNTWDEGNIRNLMRILSWFHLASGLKVNWNKSTLMGVKVLASEITRVSLALGCKVGGLGVGSLKALNIALLSKWWWRFKTESGSFWKDVIVALHGDGGALGLNISDDGILGVWGKIASIDKETEKLNIPLDGLFRKTLGNGVSISTSLTGFTLTWSWRIPLREGRELNDLSKLQHLCEQVRFEGGEDRWSWALECNGNFSVASLRHALDDMSLRRSGICTKWLKAVPAKVRLLNWRVKLNKLPTKDNLLTRGVILDNSLCAFCSDDIESKDHIFRDCCKVQEVRRILNRWWAIFQEDGSGDLEGNRLGTVHGGSIESKKIELAK
ncbi:hypothetical protein OSB04_002339 [Centaurea solstitialis]|uniref:Integrase catalytic domain-containing protein n=1 Tax=Centaurea solstitialis TaxID=347529 RepID=A0AA38U0B1_9ASTR|nr:hypothetical protein OSB04_002339 [Centaurea solstitialis]